MAARVRSPSEIKGQLQRMQMVAQLIVNGLGGIGFTLQTHAYSLANHSLIRRDDIENRPEDVAWATQKLVWLWAQAFPTEPPPSTELA